MQISCSKKIAIEPIKIIAPIHLVQVEELPNFLGKTNGDLLEYTKILQDTILKQNINIKAIRTWLETL